MTDWAKLGVPHAIPERRWARSDGRVSKAHRFRLRKRDIEKARAQNTGVFLCMPSPDLPDEFWEKEAAERVTKAMETLRQFREILRKGGTIPDFEAARKEAAAKLLLSKVEDATQWRGSK